MTAVLQFGTGTTGIKLMGSVFPVSMEAPVELKPWRIEDLSGGIIPLSTVLSIEEGGDKQYYNEGLMCLPGGIVSLPYLSTVQTTLSAIDISGYRALNRRVHGVMWPTTSGSRLILGVGPNIYLDTSVTNPALVAPATADAVTDNILSMWWGYIGSALRLFIGTDSTTDDCKSTADPTAATIVWAEAVTYANAADRVFAGQWFPQLGAGWNVFVGIINNVPGLYAFKGSATAPLTSSTLTPVVFTDTKGVEGTIATVTTAATTCATGSAEYGTGDLNGDLSNSTRVLHWLIPANIVSSNDSKATSFGGVTFSVAAPLTDILLASGFDLSAVPLSNFVTGILVEVEHSESNADDNILMATLELLVNGSQVGINLADGVEIPVTASEAYSSYGSSTIRYGTRALTGADLQFGLTVRIQYVSSAGAAVTVSVDHVRVTITHRPPGALGSLTGGGSSGGIGAGGWSPGPMKSRPNTLVYVKPKTDDATAVNVERELIFINLAYDTAGDRVTFSIEKPYTPFAYIEDAFEYLGGIVVFGGPAAGPAKYAGFIDKSGQFYDLGFPQVHGTAAVRLVTGWAAENAIMAWVAHNDSTDCQLWWYFDQRWAPYGALFSKPLAGAMSTQPLAWAERTMGTQQEQIYAIYPSGVNTAALRQFVPANPFSDPQLTNTAQVKQNGTLYVQLPEIAIGPLENRNAILALQPQSRYIDNNTSYGSLRSLVETGGDKTIAAAEIDQTFDAVAETFVDRNVQSTSTSPGVAATTAIVRLIGNHEAGTTETPNLTPLVLHTASQGPLLPKFLVRVEDAALQPKALLDRLGTLQAAKAVQQFEGTGYNGPAVIEKYGPVALPARLGTAEPNWKELHEAGVAYIEIVFAQVRGGVT